MKKFLSKKSINLVVTAIPLSFLFFSSIPRSHVQATETWYDLNWLYRKSIIIDNTNNSNNLTNYQIRIGASYNSHMKSDFSDIRFVDSNNITLLDYWIKSYISSDSSTFWVEIPSISGNSLKTIYMYYGNSSAVSLSSGEATFRLFDDFNDNSINNFKWQLIDGYGEIKEQNQRLEVKAKSVESWALREWLKTINTYDSPLAIDFDGYGEQSGANPIHHEVASRWDGLVRPLEEYGLPQNAILTKLHDAGSSAGNSQIFKYPGEDLLATSENVLNAQTWYSYSITDDSSKVTLYYDDTKLTEATASFSGGSYVGLTAREYPNPYSVYFDNVRIRNFANPEPSVTFNQEEYPYYILNAPSNIEILKTSNWTTDVSETGQYGIVNIGIKNASRRIAAFDVDFSTDRDWSLLTADSIGNKSFFHYPGGFMSIPGASGNGFVLYVPKGNGTKVGICPDATFLNEVNENCTNLIILDENSSGVEIATEDDIEYWKVSFLFGSGGYSFSEDVQEELPATGESVLIPEILGLMILFSCSRLYKKLKVT